MLERIRHMLIKEFIQVFRDPRMRAVIFIMPVIQLVVFSYAVTTDVTNIVTAIWDLDNSTSSRELIARFTGSGYFRITSALTTDAQARALMDRGDVQAIIHVNKGFGSDLQAGRSAPVQLLLDGTDSNTAGIVLQYASRIAGQYSQELLESHARRMAGTAPRAGSVELRTRAWFNENLESRNFYVPGIMAILVTLVTLILTSMAIVREKEIGTMEQIMVTPIRPVEFILGKIIPFALIGFADVFLVTAVGVLWFEVPVRGSLGVLFGATGIYLMTTLGTGLLISTLSQTQQQAMLSTVFFLLPVLLLSGFMFPIANMPVPVQWLTVVNPMRYYLVIIRGIFLKGVGVDILWPQMLALFLLGAAILWIATGRFHKTMA